MRAFDADALKERFQNGQAYFTDAIFSQDRYSTDSYRGAAVDTI